MSVLSSLFFIKTTMCRAVIYFCFFFNDTATTEIYTLSLHDALPIYGQAVGFGDFVHIIRGNQKSRADRKSTRLNSSHANISYAVFCLKKKNDYTAAALRWKKLQRRTSPWTDTAASVRIPRVQAWNGRRCGFFYNHTATTEIYTLSLHDALPISRSSAATCCETADGVRCSASAAAAIVRSEEHTSELQSRQYIVCRLLLEKK